MQTTTTSRRIALIPGDGIGTEVAASARAVLAALDARHDLGLQLDEFDWSCQRYLEEGALMPPDGLETLARYDAVLLGAVGWPDVPDHVSLWGLLIPIRRAFKQYVNLRPVRSFAGVAGPLAEAETRAIDLVIVRENNEGEYSEVGGRFGRGGPGETAIQESVFTRHGISRIADYALTVASGRGRHLTSATKSNGLVHSMPFWDEVVRERAATHPEVQLVEEHIDALAAKLVLRPESFDVIVASNLFGDILSDLAAAVTGSIGIAPSANLDPTHENPSMFEPVHGSAPDIAGKGLANPIGMLWSTALMLDHLDATEAAARLMAAIEETLRSPDPHRGHRGHCIDRAGHRRRRRPRRCATDHGVPPVADLLGLAGGSEPTHQRDHRSVEVLRERRDRAASVFLADHLADLPVLRRQVAARFVNGGQRAQAQPGLGDHRREHALQSRALRSRDQSRVEVEVAARHQSPVTGPLRALHSANGLVEGLVGRRGTRGGRDPAYGRGLQRLTGEVDVHDVLGAHDRHEDTSVRLTTQEALLDETLQRLADRAATDAEGLGQLHLVELGARGQDALDDVGADPLPHDRRERRSGNARRGAALGHCLLLEKPLAAVAASSVEALFAPDDVQQLTSYGARPHATGRKQCGACRPSQAVAPWRARGRFRCRAGC